MFRKTRYSSHQFLSSHFNWFNPHALSDRPSILICRPLLVLCARSRFWCIDYPGSYVVFQYASIICSCLFPTLDCDRSFSFKVDRCVLGICWAVMAPPQCRWEPLWTDRGTRRNRPYLRGGSILWLVYNSYPFLAARPSPVLQSQAQFASSAPTTGQTRTWSQRLPGSGRRILDTGIRRFRGLLGIIHQIC